MSFHRILLGTSLVLLASCSVHEPVSDTLAEAPGTTVADGSEAQAGEGEAAGARNEDAPPPAPPAAEPARGDESKRQAAERAQITSTRDTVATLTTGADADVDDLAYAEEAEATLSQDPADGRAARRKSESSSAASAPMGVAGGTVSGRPGPKMMPATSAAMPPTEPLPDVVTTYGSTEQYTDHGVNPFTMVRDDAQSTFSIDVDTASFTIARKKLDAGVLPPPEAVRVEEFVNYLDYGYRAPTDGGPFAVHMAAMPDPFRDGHHVLRVGVQGKEVSRDERPPLHLTFLVDVSGSMSSADKLGLAKESLHMLVDSLREDDTVALATYAGRVAKILDPTSAGDKRQIHDAIEALNAGGSTAMSSGIDLAYGMAWESFQPGHENRVIVLSDGDANVGRTSWDDMLSQVKGYADRGVTLSTIGFGMGNYKDTLMEQLSNKGDGNNYYIDGREQAQRVFVEDLGGTLVTIARDVKIQVEFNPESVLAYRLIGYENRDIADKDFRNDKVDAGEVGAGHNVTALYSVILKDGYTRDLATVRLRWEQPGADVDQGGSGAIEKAFRFQDRALAERVDFAAKDLRMAYATATFAEVLRHSPEVEELSMDQLIAFAKSARRAGEQDDIALVDLMERARSLGAGTSSGSVTSR